MFHAIAKLLFQRSNYCVLLLPDTVLQIGKKLDLLPPLDRPVNRLTQKKFCVCNPPIWGVDCPAQDFF